MKKLLVLGAFALLGGAAQAQEGFKIGGHIGVPVSDASDVSSFTLGVDAAYMWNITKGLDLGVTTGYSHFFGKDHFDDFGFIPVAVSGNTYFCRTRPWIWYFYEGWGRWWILRSAKIRISNDVRRVVFRIPVCEQQT